MNKTIGQAIEDIKRLREKSDELMNQLAHSLAIKELWEDAFAMDGKAETYLTGSLLDVMNAELVITNSVTKESKRFPVKEIPFVLIEPFLLEIRAKMIEEVRVYGDVSTVISFDKQIKKLREVLK